MKAEFQRQVENLLAKGYPEAAGLSRKRFLALLKPLGSRLRGLPSRKPDFGKGYLPFVLVVKSELVPAEKAVALARWGAKPGIAKLYPRRAVDFRPIEGLGLPAGGAYLLAGIDRGEAGRNVAPAEALKAIRRARRSPLTLEEGVAVLTHFPEFLVRNHCFSLPASRCPGDKRVPAIWISRGERANLGWCWDGNPHTWLGSASCRRRIG